MKRGEDRQNKGQRKVLRILAVLLMVLVAILAVLTFVKRQELFSEGAGKEDTGFGWISDIKRKLAEVLHDEESEEPSEGPALKPVSVEEFMSLPAGTIVDITQIDTPRLPEYFSVNAIGDDVFQRINGRSYVENENIGLDGLRYIKTLHYNYDHRIQVGELIVNAGIAEDIRNIFLELFEQDYEIQSMYLVEQYWTGDGVSTDKNSIENNNTSAFNYRTIPGLTDLSNHALGYAIDVNPLQNPYVAYNEDGSFRETYKDMERYIDRNAAEAHMISHEDACYQIFTKYGFTWGGDWEGVKDYQHFEKR